MPTSDDSWSAKLRVIGDLERNDHWHLQPHDSCAFFGEYTARGGFAHSAANQTIANIKKKPSLKGTTQWIWKGRDISRIGRAIADNIEPAQLASTTFVPIPPSKSANHPDYDDRMAQIARSIGPGVDVRELLFSIRDREAFHTSSSTRDLAALRQNIGIHQEHANRPAFQIVLLDDVLVTGCSFKVCQQIVNDIWPTAAVYGLFVARRIIPRNNFEGIELI